VRDTGRSAIFQVALSMRTNAGSGLDPGGELVVAPFVVEAVATRFDLELDLVAVDGMATGTGPGCPARSSTTATCSPARQSNASQTLSSTSVRAVATTGPALSRLLTVTGAAREQLLISWNDTAADFPADQTLHELIQAKAAADPDAPAVTFEATTLTTASLPRAPTRSPTGCASTAAGARAARRVCAQPRCGPRRRPARRADLGGGLCARWTLTTRPTGSGSCSPTPIRSRS